MIISASRRTDIPAFYADWFFQRLREGFVYVRNPINPRQVGRVSLSPAVVDGIVFWSKNPAPMIGRLRELGGIPYYFQYTLNPYGQDVEPHLPDKREVLLPILQRLADTVGAERVNWRYDPILLNDTYTIPYHLGSFNDFTKRLKGYVTKCTFSILDMYPKTVRNTRDLRLKPISQEDMLTLARGFSQIARANDLALDTCAETVDLSTLNIGHARCVDGGLLEHLGGCKLTLGKDPNQRPACGCAASIDIGAYDTCLQGCRYCYANASAKTALANHLKHNPTAPLLFGEVGGEDVVYERNVASCKVGQERLL